ncbi:MAG: acetyltransferase [Burkholderiales bacterium]|nr:acetyltransferase [Burkholderiales bacterium]
MTRFDVFNGDADGLCALQQLRLAQPVDAVLVTGAKRDIALLERVDAAPGDAVTVLDVSLAANRNALLRVLDRGADVLYFDHHAAGDVPSHPRLRATIDTDPALCTSLIVDRWLGGRHRPWAIVGAYGDGLVAEADALAAAAGFDEDRRRALRGLGEDLNYNAYGDSTADLLVPPAALAVRLRGHADPLALPDDDGLLARLGRAHRDDVDRALAQPVAPVGEHACACILPDAAWSRRVRGVLANALARRAPQRGCAVVSPRADGGLAVSVRAPLVSRRGADALCRRFGGEGRAGAAGIDDLPRARLDEFMAALRDAFAPAADATAAADRRR